MSGINHFTVKTAGDAGIRSPVEWQVFTSYKRHLNFPFFDFQAAEVQTDLDLL